MYYLDILKLFTLFDTLGAESISAFEWVHKSF